MPEQGLGPVDVEDHPGVGLAGDGKGDARGDVGLDHAGDDVGRGTLGGHHQVDADGPRFLGQADDVVLHLLRRDHHEVGQLVDDDEDVGQRPLSAPRPALVHLGQAAGMLQLHELVAVLHLLDHVVKHAGGVLHVGHHRHQQMRDAVVVRQLDLLGVDHDHAHLLRGAAQQDRRDQAVDAAALARAGGAGDEQVRELGEVGVDGLAGDVLAQPDHERSGRLGELPVDVAQGDEVGPLVGHLHPHRRLAGDGREDADLGAGQSVGQVVLEAGDLAHLRARSQLQLVPRDPRARPPCRRPAPPRRTAPGPGAARRRCPARPPIASDRRGRRSCGAARLRAAGRRAAPPAARSGAASRARPGSASCSSAVLRARLRRARRSWRPPGVPPALAAPPAA